MKRPQLALALAAALVAAAAGTAQAHGHRGGRTYTATGPATTISAPPSRFVGGFAAAPAPQPYYYATGHTAYVPATQPRAMPAGGGHYYYVSAPAGPVAWGR